MKNYRLLHNIAGVVLCGILIGAAPCEAADEVTCIYRKSNGSAVQVNSPDKVPEAYRATANCFQYSRKAREHLAAPDEVLLKGTVRQEMVNSALGPMKIRWPRKVELLFGRTPLRAVTDAASSASRALKQGGFTVELQRFSTEWNIVFLDESLPETQIPSSLISGCHPGWMTPPGNVYIVAQRVAEGCGPGAQQKNRTVADGELTAVLIHEMGHAIEFQLLGAQFLSGHDRMRAEGFASWFEQFAANYSDVIADGKQEKLYRQLASISLKQQPGQFVFSGSPYDYGRASMYFRSVQNKRGVRGVMDLYKKMGENKLQLTEAIQQVMGWTPLKLQQEVQRTIEQ